MDILDAVETNTDDDLRFDPSIDIDKGIKTELFDRAKEDLKSGNYRGYSLLAMRLMFLFPERKKELRPNNSDFEKIVIQIKNSGKWAQAIFSEFISAVCCLRPDRSGEIIPSETKFEEMNTELKERRGNNIGIMRFIVMAVPMLILYPERRESLGLNEETFFECLKELNSYYIYENWDSFIECATLIVLAYPDRKSEIKLDDKSWKGMMDLLARYRNDARTIDKDRDVYLYNLHYYSETAICLKILAAERVDILSAGRLKFTYKQKPLVEARRPLPERSRVKNNYVNKENKDV